MKIKSSHTTLPQVSRIETAQQTTVKPAEKTSVAATSSNSSPASGETKMLQSFQGQLRRHEIESHLNQSLSNQPDISKIDFNPLGIHSIESSKAEANKDSVQQATSESYVESFDLGSTEENRESKETGDSSKVLVEFETGDARKPYVLGNLWNSNDSPPESSKDEDS